MGTPSFDFSCHHWEVEFGDKTVQVPGTCKALESRKENILAENGSWVVIIATQQEGSILQPVNEGASKLAGSFQGYTARSQYDIYMASPLQVPSTCL